MKELIVWGLLVVGGLLCNGCSRHSDGIRAAAEHGDVDAVTRLLRDGVDVNTAGRFRWSLLHIAAFKGHMDVVKVLVENGAHLNSETLKLFDTPLDLAEQAGHIAIAEYLKQRGARGGHMRREKNEGNSPDNEE